MRIELVQGPSKVAGRTRSELVADLFDPSDSDPDVDAGLRTWYKALPPEGAAFIRRLFDDLEPKLKKFGFVKTANVYECTSVPDGVTRKVYKMFLKGFDELIELGEREGKKKGRSSHHEWDDEGKRKT